LSSPPWLPWFWGCLSWSGSPQPARKRPSTVKQKQSLAEFSAQAQANSLFLQVKDTTFNNRSIETGSGAKLAGSVTLETGTEVPAMFRLVKENGKWKLIGYRIGS
jgi:hypothetical protein